MKKIKITKFALRHFDPKFGGTKVLDMTAEKFEELIQFDIKDFFNSSIPLRLDARIMNGYATFCKLLAIKNFTDAKVGSLPITLENYQYLRSGYSARRDSELPIFSRWFELPLDKPKAEWLILVLYSKEQIDKEDKENDISDCDFCAEWGVVAILGQSHPNEEPMKPETMIRNAGYNTERYQKIVIDKLRTRLEVYCQDQDNEHVSDDDIKKILSLQGTIIGGSGVPLNEEKYLQSVEFWQHNATVK